VTNEAMENKYFNLLLNAAEYIKEHIDIKPQIGVILGSGLGKFTDEIKGGGSISYSDIPGFPNAAMYSKTPYVSNTTMHSKISCFPNTTQESHRIEYHEMIKCHEVVECCEMVEGHEVVKCCEMVEGHEGCIVWGRVGEKHVVALKGRFHYYEGYDILQVVFAVRALKLAGVDKLIVTNAAGGINKDFSPGDLILITDHISFFAPSPLRGMNIPELGVRFPDMTEAYCPQFIEIAEKVAKGNGINLKKGVYAFAQGPMYETPAEIRALAALGADAVGMSTVPEVIAARHAGIKVLGISCITNLAAGILGKPLTHKEVITNAKKAENDFIRLLCGFIQHIDEI
jgi:purine-nucleoside phosphorylase